MADFVGEFLSKNELITSHIYFHLYSQNRCRRLKVAQLT